MSRTDFTFFVPSCFDLEAHKAANPISCIPSFKDEKLLYILHTVTSLPAFYKGGQYPGGYIPINASTLRFIIGKEYRYYLEYLVDTGILECNYSFNVWSHQSTGYRFTPAYQCRLSQITMPISKPLSKHLEDDYYDGRLEQMDVVIDGITHAITTEDIEPVILPDTLKSKLPCKAKDLSRQEITLFNTMMRRDHHYAFKWIDQGGLKIDHEAAHSYNAGIWQYKKDKPELWDREYSTKQRKTIVKHPYNQYLAGYVAIEKIKGGNRGQRFDPNVFRFHTPLTNMKSELRNFITWEGLPLVAVDISSSQPTLLVGLFDPAFWKGEKEFSIFSLPYSYIPPTLRLAPLIMMCDFIQRSGGDAPEDVQKYIDLLQTGNFKAGFRELVALKTGRIYRGDDIKPVIFQTLYTCNRFIGQPEAAPKRAFRDIFPTIYKFTALLKQGYPEFLPTILQRMESYLVFHKILPRIAYERPDLPIFTIHDSLVVTKSNETYVERVMFEEISKAIGIRPHFKLDQWTPSNLQLP